MKNQQWFKLEGNKSATSLFAQISAYDVMQPAQQANNLLHYRMYNARDIQSLSIANYVTSTVPNSNNQSSGLKPSAINLNVIKSVIDTLVAKVTKNKIKPTFLTTGGTLTQRTDAKKLTNFNFGVLYAAKAYNIAPLVFRDACIFGTGFIKVFLESKKIVIERVFPDEILIDPADGYYNNPRQLIQRKFYTKDSLIDLFPDHEVAINSAKEIYMSHGDNMPVIMVAEAWYLPKGKSKGKHCIAINGTMLFEEQYKDNFFPFVKYDFNEPVLGYWGSGIAEELKGIQIEIGRLLYHIQESMRLLQKPRIYMEMGSKVNPKHLNTDIGTIVPYTGQAPIIYTAQTVHPEIFQQLESLYLKAYEIVGLSQLSANSQKPSGLNSGRALAEYNDIETERFANIAQRYEQFFVDMSEVVIKCLSKLGNYKANTFDKMAGVKSIDFKDIKAATDDYVIQTFPSSALPTTPAARLDVVNQMAEAGYIDPEVAKQLLDFPDLEAFSRTELAPMQFVSKSIESALLEGEYIEPEPYQPLDLSIKLAQQYYCWGKANNAPEKNLDLVRTYIDDCLSLQAMVTVPEAVSPAQSMSQAMVDQTLMQPQQAPMMPEQQQMDMANPLQMG